MSYLKDLKGLTKMWGEFCEILAAKQRAENEMPLLER